MKKNDGILIISTGFIAGFIFGFFKAGISGELAGIISKRYFPYGSFRLIFLKFQSPLQKWFLYALLTSILLIIVVFIIRSTGIVEWVLNTRRNKKKLRIVSITALVLFIFLSLINITSIVYPGAGISKGPNVLIIVIDALREDTLGISGYTRNTSPNIDEFAKNSVIFKNAYTSSSWTKPAVASLFSALHPIRHNTLEKQDSFPDVVNTLTEVLKNDGYKTFFLCGGNLFIGKHFNFDQGFDHYFNKKTDAAGLTGMFSSLLPELKKGKFFAYLHYMDVHLPYGKNKFNYLFSNGEKNKKLIPGKIFRWTVGKLKRNDQLTSDDKRDLKALYDGQVRYVDENIGKLLGMLKKEFLLENTLIFITSDHGEEFWDHGGFEHGHSMYNELIRIPLIIGGNGLKPSIMKKIVRIIDIFPTILDVTKTPFPDFNIDGSSFKKKLIRGDAGIGLPVFTAGIFYGENKYSLIKNEKKIILNTLKKIEGTGSKFSKNNFYEYYNISIDPKETENIAGIKKTETSKLVRELKKYILAYPAFNKKEVPLHKKIREKLKTLGYL